MSIVKSTNKKTGITYVYESESYWDKEKKQPRNRRKLIGKLDEAGNIVPTGKKGRKKTDDGAAIDPKLVKDLEESLAYYQEKSHKLEIENSMLNQQLQELKDQKEALVTGMERLIRDYR
ncbi:MAG: hypothetical protein IJ137_04390 [Eubacterium sp.]|nr:hypothetical protein [Eubacterium sp.]